MIRRFLLALVAIALCVCDASGASLKLKRHTGSADYPGAPAAVTSPASGTALTSVWNLQTTGATGPRYAFSNGTWVDAATSLAGGSYLANLGCALNNFNDILCTIPDNTAVVIEKFDFTGSPDLSFYGNNITVTLRDNRIRSQVIVNQDINRTPQPTQSVTLYSEHNEYDGITGSAALPVMAISFASNILFEGQYDRYKNQKGPIWYAGHDHVTRTRIYMHNNYITGGFVDPLEGAHIELIQDIPTIGACVLGCYFKFNNNIVNLIDGQATAAWTSGGATALFSEGAVDAVDQSLEFRNNIFLGLTAANANPNNPNAVCCEIQYGDNNVNAADGFILDNNVMNPGTGYITKGAGSLKPTASGNRNDSNVPLTLSDFN